MTIPVMICGGQCLEDVEEGRTPIKEIRVFPYTGFQIDMISEEMARRIKMDIKLNVGECRFRDALGAPVEIYGTGIAKLSRLGGPWSVKRLAVCRKLSGQMLISRSTKEGLSRL